MQYGYSHTGFGFEIGTPLEATRKIHVGNQTNLKAGRGENEDVTAEKRVLSVSNDWSHADPKLKGRERKERKEKKESSPNATSDGRCHACMKPSAMQPHQQATFPVVCPRAGPGFAGEDDHPQTAPEKSTRESACWAANERRGDWGWASLFRAWAISFPGFCFFLVPGTQAWHLRKWSGTILDRNPVGGPWGGGRWGLVRSTVFGMIVA